MFCQAIELVDGVRVGCSHAAAREGDALAPLLRAGPRAPFVLTCAAHAQQLRAHMCCPACGVFCTQVTTSSSLVQKNSSLLPQLKAIVIPLPSQN